MALTPVVVLAGVAPILISIPRALSLGPIAVGILLDAIGGRWAHAAVGATS